MTGARRLVAGVDTSTQACKVVVRDADTGALVRSGRAPHPPGTEVPPSAWEEAFIRAAAEAGGLDDVAALAVGGQQHGMVCLDEDGEVVRDALLWNDVRSAAAAHDLVLEQGDGDEAAGRQAWADAVGLVPVASFTASKLRWLADAEPDHADRTAAVCLPHDWLTWRLSADRSLRTLVTDRGDASGTAYWSARTGEYRLDLLEQAMRGRRPAVPRVAGPAERVGTLAGGTALLGPGTGDNAAAALGLAARPGDVVVGGPADHTVEDLVADLVGGAAGETGEDDGQPLQPLVDPGAVVLEQTVGVEQHGVPGAELQQVVGAPGGDVESQEAFRRALQHLHAAVCPQQQRRRMTGRGPAQRPPPGRGGRCRRPA